MKLIQKLSILDFVRKIDLIYIGQFGIVISDTNFAYVDFIYSFTMSNIILSFYAPDILKYVLRTLYNFIATRD